MLAPQRQQAILAQVRRAGGVRVADLVAELGVSDMTIRRDLEVLAERGLVLKVHGGATAPPSGVADEPGFAAKAERQRAEKAALAEAAAAHVQPGSAVALSAGTTTVRIAQRLVDVPGLTVVTNSIPVADVFYRSGRPDQTVVLTGGTRTPSDALVGPIAIAALHDLHVDQLFLGVHGMSVEAGLTTPNLLEAETDRALIRATRRLIVVADHTKWDTLGIASIASLPAAHLLITDAEPPEGVRELCAVELTDQ
ncbi:DeoR/GlpR family DNA-binding transcription regulator [Catellatospora sp. KI3]|uniref:DeoR/GlpR family DNA-binding transcription regulator n=1 Tax=Catellatospora sp. KI3 TaxID=3041620 RepID=UPI002482D0F0|nr:DeoR/GlpR family DNA-binding transcription regulator [Catellatospora sp. KI3]MDI1460375.1 DeoR/GlpR family DNA-binding transcription regulator [Catellatospora sp. KI3]